MALRAFCLRLAVASGISGGAACGAEATQSSAPTHAPQPEEPRCAVLKDAAAQREAQSFAAASNILEYEAAFRRAYPAAALGGIGAAEVRAVVRAHTTELSACYEAALAQVDEASGRVSVRFVIDGQGHVAAAHLASDELGVPGVGCCLVQRVAAWTFPTVAGGFALVEYPFTVRLSHHH